MTRAELRRELARIFYFCARTIETLPDDDDAPAPPRTRRPRRAGGDVSETSDVSETTASRAAGALRRAGVRR